MYNKTTNVLLFPPPDKSSIDLFHFSLILVDFDCRAKYCLKC